jgi:hypothetical protein
LGVVGLVVVDEQHAPQQLPHIQAIGFLPGSIAPRLRPRQRIIPGPIMPGMEFIIGMQDAAIVVSMNTHGSTESTPTTMRTIKSVFAHAGQGS